MAEYGELMRGIPSPKAPSPKKGAGAARVPHYWAWVASGRHSPTAAERTRRLTTPPTPTSTKRFEPGRPSGSIKSMIRNFSLPQLDTSGTESICGSPLSDSASHLSKSGLLSFKRHRLADTLHNCEDALGYSPSCSSAWRTHATANMELGDYESAVEDWSNSLKGDPLGKSMRWSSWHARAAAKEKIGDLEGAIEDCSEALQQNPYFSPSWSTRSSTKLKLLLDDDGRIDAEEIKELSAAELDCTRAIELDPGDSRCWHLRGAVRMSLGREEEAESDSSKAIKCEPTKDSYLKRADIRAKRENIEGAIRDCTKALSIRQSQSGKDSEAWTQRALCKLKSGDLEGALADCTAAIRHQMDASRPWEIRAEAKLKQGDYTGTIRDCTEALSLMGHSRDRCLRQTIKCQNVSRIQFEEKGGGDICIKQVDFNGEAFSLGIRAGMHVVEVSCAYGNDLWDTRNIGMAQFRAMLASRSEPGVAFTLETEEKPVMGKIMANCMQTLCHRGKANFQKGLYENAAKDFEDALVYDPDSEYAAKMLERSMSLVCHSGAWSTTAMRQRLEKRQALAARTRQEDQLGPSE
eukprot:TRINITY_DN27833_c0_g1_i1.p1 TRINITY_DN27833_c0_g1~~TRINITY_DN27833_c0_g1_i1.p1  ORF type:complete len:578 (-),score=93.64 TRINITY_DN27833_c0_g1_i1:54-1787(-)